MSTVTWPVFADRVAPQREALYPGCVPLAGRVTCPLHNDDLGPISGMCAKCFGEAWAWTGRLYLAERGSP